MSKSLTLLDLYAKNNMVMFEDEDESANSIKSNLFRDCKNKKWKYLEEKTN